MLSSNSTFHVTYLKTERAAAGSVIPGDIATDWHDAAILYTGRVTRLARPSVSLFVCHTSADFHRAMVASAPGTITPHRAPPPYEELDLRHEFAHLFSGKSTKTAATNAALFDSSMHQIVCRLGLRSRPNWGSLHRSPRPLAGFEGPYF